MRIPSDRPSPTLPDPQELISRLERTAPRPIRRREQWQATWHGWRDATRPIPTTDLTHGFPARLNAHAQTGHMAVDTRLAELLTEVHQAQAALDPDPTLPPPPTPTTLPDLPAHDADPRARRAARQQRAAAARSAAAAQAEATAAVHRTRSTATQSRQLDALAQDLTDIADKLRHQHTARAYQLATTYHHQLLRRHPHTKQLPTPAPRPGPVVP